jgi:hypothetical protein
MLAPLAFLFGRMNGLKTLLGDCDTGWHIRTGEWILANHKVPLHDMFSFSKPGEPWFAWEWLSDILMALLFRLGGLQAVSIFFVALISLTFAGLYLLTRRRSNPVVGILVAVVATAASSIHWLARPHLFTLFFLVVFYSALERVRDGQTRIAGMPILAILPVLTVLWTNLHGGFFVGAALIGAYGAGEVARLLIGPAVEDRTAHWKLAKQYIASSAACVAASLINPYTYQLHLHMVRFLGQPWKNDHILEFFSPSFHHPTAMFFEAMLALSVVASVSFIRKGRYTEAITMMVWAHGGLVAGRNIPIFVIVAAPPVAAAIYEWLGGLPASHAANWIKSAAERLNRIAKNSAVTDAMPRYHLVTVAAMLTVAAVIFAPHPPKKFRAEFDPEAYPAKALDALRSDMNARVFTNDEWGDYLIYRGRRVFVDGRSDYYEDTFEQDYIDVMNVKYGWEKTLNRFHIDAILLPPDAPLAGALKESSKWRVTYDDHIALIFRPVDRVGGETVSVAGISRIGDGRDREVTKTEASDRAITKDQNKPKT